MCSSSPASFDPYFEWLGIARDERPADHYRLLGLTRFESDRDRIEAAADERLNLVRRHQTGPRGSFVQPLLNELSAARSCLLGADSKPLYDEQLRQATRAPVARIVAAPIVAAADPPLASPPASMAQDADAETSDEPATVAAHALPASPMVLFLGMAAVVVLVAGGTFTIGRYLLRPKATAPAPISAHRPAIESDEKNPVDIGEPPLRTKRSPAVANVVVMQEGSGSVNLTPATAALSGQVRLTQTGSSEQVSGWSQSGDEAAWTFHLLRPGFFELAVTYAALDEAGETPLLVALDDEALKTFSLPPTGTLDKWSTRRQTIAITAGGQHRLALQLAEGVSSGSFCIRQVRLTPLDAKAEDFK